MRIRPARERDVETLVDELWRPFMDALLADDPDTELADEFRGEQLQETGRIDRVADDDGRLLGYVSAEVRESAPVVDRGDTLHINEVYVRPEHRRDGLGTALLAHAEEWGEQQGCVRLTLSVDAPNDGAQALYREHGFETIRYRMRKPLE